MRVKNDLSAGTGAVTKHCKSIGLAAKSCSEKEKVL